MNSAHDVGPSIAWKTPRGSSLTLAHKYRGTQRLQNSQEECDGRAFQRAALWECGENRRFARSRGAAAHGPQLGLALRALEAKAAILAALHSAARSLPSAALDVTPG